MNLSAAEYRQMQTKPARSKYGAKRYCVDGIWFHSIAEGKEYERLRQRVSDGEIGPITIQPEFPLLVDGIQVGKYRADFQFFDKVAGRERTIDVKGFDTPLSRWKRKHVKAQYGIDVEIVK